MLLILITFIVSSHLVMGLEADNSTIITRPSRNESLPLLTVLMSFTSFGDPANAIRAIQAALAHSPSQRYELAVEQIDDQCRDDIAIAQGIDQLRSSSYESTNRLPFFLTSLCVDVGQRAVSAAAFYR